MAWTPRMSCASAYYHIYNDLTDSLLGQPLTTELVEDEPRGLSHCAPPLEQAPGFPSPNGGELAPKVLFTTLGPYSREISSGDGWGQNHQQPYTWKGLMQIDEEVVKDC